MSDFKEISLSANIVKMNVILSKSESSLVSEISGNSKSVLEVSSCDLNILIISSFKYSLIILEVTVS